MIALTIIGLRSLTREEIMTRPGIMALTVGTIAGLARASTTLAAQIYEYEFHSKFDLVSLPYLSYRSINLGYNIWSDNWAVGISIAFVWVYMRLSGG